MVFKSCASQIIHYICGLRSECPRGEEVLTAELSGTHLMLHLQIDLLEYTRGSEGFYSAAGADGCYNNKPSGGGGHPSKN